MAGVTQDTAITTIVIRTVAGTRENLAQYYFITSFVIRQTWIKYHSQPKTTYSLTCQIKYDCRFAKWDVNSSIIQ